MMVSAGTASALRHDGFDKLLRKYVSAGRVDYAGLRTSGREALARYVRQLATAKLDESSRAARLAFYLNAYNALVLHSVVEAGPDLRSVTDLEGFFDKRNHDVAGRRLTLNQLENEVIRPTFRDPRIHFALVCAAKSCPPLPARAFRAATVDKVLERLTRRFLQSKRGVTVADGGFKISKLFEWYPKDFEDAAGSVRAYLARYRPDDALALQQGKLSFLDYNWALNGR